MSGSRILVVDSDREHAGHCKSFLSQAGFEVTLVPDASAAAAVLAGASFAAVLLDVPCPGAVGEARERAAEQGATVVEMSDIFVGRTNRELARNVYGAVDLWTKPVRADVALAVLKTRPGVEAPEPQSSPGRARLEKLGDAFLATARSLDRSGAATKTDEPEPALTESGGSRREALGLSGASGRTVEVGAPPELDTDLLEGSGSLADSTFATVLFKLATDEATGELRVTHGVVRKSIYVDGGRVVGVSSDAPADRLEVVLRADGIIGPKEVDAIERRMGRAALESEAAYAEIGVIDAEEVGRLRGVLARRRLLEPFGWADGTWVFVATPPRAGVRAELDASTLELVWEGAQHGESPNRIRDLLGPYLERPLAWTGQPPSRGDIVLTRWQRAIIGSIDGETPASEVIVGARDRDAALALIYTLVVAGRVGFTA